MLVRARREKRRERALSDSQTLIYKFTVPREDTPIKESGKRGPNTALSENSRKRALLKTPVRLADMIDIVQASKEVARAVTSHVIHSNEVSQPQSDHTSQLC